MNGNHSAAALAQADPSLERDGAGPTLHVERFAWEAPDRLELLLGRNGEEVRRLRVDADGLLRRLTADGPCGQREGMRC